MCFFVDRIVGHQRIIQNRPCVQIGADGVDDDVLHWPALEEGGEHVVHTVMEHNGTGCGVDLRVVFFEVKMICCGEHDP